MAPGHALSPDYVLPVKAAAVLGLTMIALARLRGEDLPKNTETNPAEIEPPVLPGNLVPEESPKREPTNEIDQLERKLVAAKESEAGAERLFKIGVLAKVEAENRALRVVKLQAELAQARVAAIQLEFDRRQQQFTGREITQRELELTEMRLNQAKQAAELALADQKKAELDAAVINLTREQKLLALGSGRKSAVRRAEEKLAELRRASQ